MATIDRVLRAGVNYDIEPYSIHNTNSTTTNYIAARGENLLTNGSFLLGNGYNFPSSTKCVFDQSDNYYCGGCLKITGQVSGSTTEFMPVDPTLEYEISYYVKSDSTSATLYDYVDMYDIDKNQITANNVMFRSGSTTTLAQDVKNGDTVIYLTSVAGFERSTTTTYRKALIIWDYKNSKGYLYPTETYSRNRTSDNIWLDATSFDTTANTITLKNPWSWGTHLAGAAISLADSGGTYSYGNSGRRLATANTWEHWTAYFKGIGRNNAALKFREGTAYVKLGWLFNYQNGASAITKYSNITFALRRATMPNNATLTIKLGTDTLGLFTADQSVSTTITIPAAPTVNDGTLTIKENGTLLGTFTANLSGNTTIDINAVTGSDLTANTVILGNGGKTVKTSGKTISTILGSDDTTIPTSKAVKDVTDDIREVAEGKCKSYVIDTESDIVGTKDPITGSYTNVTGITGVTLSNLKIGDNIYVKATATPDYWVSLITPSVSLNILETIKPKVNDVLINGTTIVSNETANIPIATTSALGVVKSQTTGTTADRNYNVEVNADGTMKVNVPWTDTVPTFTDKYQKQKSGINSGLLISEGLNGIDPLYVPLSTTSQLGTVKSTTLVNPVTGKYYDVEVESDGTMRTNVPWTDEHALWGNITGTITDQTDLNTALTNLDTDKMEKDGSNYVGSLTLVSPVITSSWIIKNLSGTQKSTSTANSISVENGAKVDYSGTFKYTAATSELKNPTRCDGAWGTTLPSPGTASSALTFTNLTSNTSKTVNLYANKSGLEVNGTKVIKATGEDKTSASASVNFYHRRYWGVSTSITQDVTALSSELSNSKAKTITFDCSGGKYFYYAYPKSLGTSSWNVGGLSFTGYTLTEQTITNEYNLSVTYYIYRSTTLQTGSSIKAIIS